MSIRFQLSMVFSVTVAVILIIQNVLSYFTVKDLLRDSLAHQNEIISKQLSLSIEQAEYAVRIVEERVGEQIRSASVAALLALSPDYREVTNEQLAALSRQVGVSHITLLVRTEDDIVGVRSSDPLEINLSTKEWGILVQRIPAAVRQAGSHGCRRPKTPQLLDGTSRGFIIGSELCR
ncbi:hypothetical protein ACP26L_03610 [Paenibacillus sp. S-38]|uniref:hypothetical protein n=1 Tax=Paenibacillus sp. S-38 TaxID=3416710 RepID=UPI003CEFF37E